MSLTLKPIGTVDEFKAILKKSKTSSKKRKSVNIETNTNKSAKKSVPKIEKISHLLHKRYELDKKESKVFPKIITCESYSDVPAYWALGSDDSEPPILAEHKVLFVLGPFKVIIKKERGLI
jgi:hypothetical protein